MKRLSAKLTYANVISTLCLVLLVGGGTAYAAAEMLPKNSVGSKQIVKGAVTPAKLSKASKTTLTGPKGDTGATGPQGPAGPKGDAGSRGERGEPGPAVQILPSGQTETGVWSTSAGNGSYAMVALPFYPKLPAPIPAANEIFVPTSAAPVPHCAGFREAQAGYLCVYEAWNFSTTFEQFVSGFGSGSGEPGEVEGTVLNFTSSNALGFARGNWAYTAS
jgi:hypothetical protein